MLEIQQKDNDCNLLQKALGTGVAAPVCNCSKEIRIWDFHKTIYGNTVVASNPDIYRD